MEQIRIGKTIEISVNDEGGTIRINAEDQNFLDKFYALLDCLEEVSARVEKEAKEQKGKQPAREQLKRVIEETRKIMEEIDGLFGEGSCRKIFGDIVPGMCLIADFFQQLLPIVSKYAAERKKDITARYNRRRKGANTPK